MKRFITLFYAFLIAGCAMAQESYDFSAVCESGQTLYYKITSSAEPYTVEVVQELDYYDDLTGNLIIPQYVAYNGKKYSVISIGDGTFNKCYSLISVTIPNSVISIGQYAFNDCCGLKSIIIGDSVKSIGYSAFSLCVKLKSITIPNSVERIENNTFEDCSSLKSVIIGNSVTSIGGAAFYGCKGLASVNISDSVTEIGGGAFEGCKKLKKNIVKKISEINENALGW